MSNNRRTHSTIDKLPASLRDTLTRMIVDNVWPDDFPRQKGTDPVLTGKPRYEDLVTYSRQKGFVVSESAVGRFGMRMRMLARMKQAGVIVRDVMKNLNAEKASETQKAVAEMITAQTIEFISSQDDLSAKQIKEISQAMRDCTQVSINADKYIREQLNKKIEAADKKISAIAVKKKIDPETLKAIREQVYGIRTK